MIDYPLARLQGAIDAGATLTVRTVDGHELEATLRSRNGGSEISAQGPDLASVASALMSAWFDHHCIDKPRDNCKGPLRAHMRAALGAFGAQQGAAGVDGYQTPGCDCDYCSAYAFAEAATEGVALAE